MKKVLSTILALMICLFSLTVYAVSNPLDNPDTAIRILEDFNYQSLEDFYGRRFTDVEKNKIDIVDGKYLFNTGLHNWSTVDIPIKGFSKKGELLAGTSGEAGNISGAAGIGIYIDCRSPYGVSQCTPSLVMEKNGIERIYKMAPESRYYLVAKDGVTYEGTAVDSGWGYGILGDIGQDFEGYMLVPFDSFFYNGEPLNLEAYRAKELEFTAYSGSILFDNVFLYGTAENQGDGDIRAFFVEPDKVDTPVDYQITDRIKEAFGLKSSDDSSSSLTLEPWVAPVIAGISLLFVIYALITVIRNNRKED